MEINGGNTSWINGNNEKHNRIIQNMVRAGLIGGNKNEKNGVVQHNHKLNYIDLKYTVNQITPNLTFNGMKKSPAFMNYKHLDAASSRLHHHLKSFMNRHKREHSWVIISVKKKKWRNPHTKKLKYCSYAIFDEHNNKFGKGWSPGS